MTTPYEYNLATDEHGHDVPVLRSMGSPGSDLGPDEVEDEPARPPEEWYDDEDAWPDSPCSWPIEEDS
jgi:hypothetical protein